jgi:ATP-dependent helicase HrpB
VWLAGHAPQLGLPDLSDAALVAAAERWLAPHLRGVRSKAQLQQLDLTSILR